ncbi:pyruvate kinase [Candidatus Uhrbacteria bacterium RIFCSPHIGHO2_12_FULL_60_25]|uniref:Pyruvate kinase n=1 Tax=Candidatus Uhrbacteria bacterium RIFCSPHIGHO2_12_FULL_60_25 TaxID=1802399 RepID=A0A1F7UNU1_9BACT|nr:MAG: pyruvate kinase [Candidatus Uhrbacteria bacterium RIFCSPHIGHO2_02_FULL_60_44]OGL79367.1 MAG: pyruvate kinase [Candidatus Uhrbacteria bacterium RIFCSPHIGHO2_12_FULL_60_25]
MKRTKIVCTIGPACDTVATMVALGKAGMNVARLNFSHGTYASHASLLTRLRKAERSLDQPFGILQDLQGPKIRVGDLPKEGVKLVDGKPVVFTTSARPVRGDITVSLPGLHHDVKRGERLLLDDGLLECVVRRIEGRRIHCEVIHGGTLTSHKGLNLPGTKLRIPALSKKDLADAAWGVAAGVDFIALSFIRSPNDVLDLRRILNRTKDGKHIMVVGKIEKQEAIDRFDDILPLLDVVMVARGDLGIETPAPKVPVIQKQLIAASRSAGKPVIVATQMLDSMQRNPRPTRAEVSDVANAVADHADAVMLSGETATGQYPVDAVRMMAETARATEASPFDDLASFNVSAERDIPELIGGSVRVASDALDHAPIVVLTSSGRTAREVSAYRPEATIHAVTNDVRVARQLQVSWGVRATVTSTTSRPDQRAKRAVSLLQRAKRLPRGQRVIVVGGPTPGKSGTANRIEVVTV